MLNVTGLTSLTDKVPTSGSIAASTMSGHSSTQLSAEHSKGYKLWRNAQKKSKIAAKDFKRNVKNKWGALKEAMRHPATMTSINHSNSDAANSSAFDSDSQVQEPWRPTPPQTKLQDYHNGKHMTVRIVDMAPEPESLPSLEISKSQCISEEKNAVPAISESMPPCPT